MANTCLMKRNCKRITKYQLKIMEQIEKKIWYICIRSATNIFTREIRIKVAGGLSGLMGNCLGPFLGEGNTATCFLLPDKPSGGGDPVT